jgi:thioredoxin-related protein
MTVFPKPGDGLRGALAALAFALLAVPTHAAEAPRDPADYFFQSTFGNFQEELAAAREQGKRGILIMFELDDCPFCHRMRQTVLNKPSIQDWYREHFLIFTVDLEGQTEVTDFQGNTMTAQDFAFRVYRVRATPVFAFFDLEGKPTVRYTGTTRDAQEFLWLGEFIADGHYRNENFTRYKREKRAAEKTSQLSP